MFDGSDKVFTNAPKLAGWLEYLAHPEEHEGPRLERYPTGYRYETEIVEVRHTKRHYGGELVGSVMKDLTIWQFFAHADVLSGQDVNAMERACQVIETVRHRSTGRDSGYEHTAVVYRNLVTEFEQAFASWTDAPGRLAQDRFKELQAWHELFDDEFFKLSVNLVKFGAVIETARKNVNELMGNIVDALQAWSAESDFGDGGLLAFIGKILEFAVSKLDPSGAAALVFSEILGEIVGEAEATPDKDTGRVHGDSCYGILGSFLVAAQDVCESAAKTTEDLEAEVRGLHTTIPPVPTLPD